MSIDALKVSTCVCVCAFSVGGKQKRNTCNTMERNDGKKNIECKLDDKWTEM